MTQRASKEEVMAFNQTIFLNVKFGLYHRQDIAGNITLKLNDKGDKHDKVGLYIDFYRPIIKILISNSEFVPKLKSKGYEIIPAKVRRDLTYFGEIHVTDIADIENILKICFGVLQNKDDDIEEDTRINIRFTQSQLNLIKQVSEAIGTHYQTYIREASLRRANEDLEKFKNNLDKSL